MKVGDLVEDRHYGVGCIVEIGYRGQCPFVRVSFPKYQNLAPGGVMTQGVSSAASDVYKRQVPCIVVIVGTKDTTVEVVNN